MTGKEKEHNKSSKRKDRGSKKRFVSQLLMWTCYTTSILTPVNPHYFLFTPIR